MHRQSKKMSVLLISVVLAIFGRGIAVQEDGCLSFSAGETPITETPKDVPMKWYETPSFVRGLDCAREKVLDYQDVSPPKPAKETKNIFSKILSAISAVVQNLYTKQADFHKNVKISKVSVKTPWLKKYKIHYRADSDSAWQAYQEQLGVDKVFDVKNDVVNTLAMPVTARYIQIKALEPKGYPSNVVKATFYGCIITDTYQVIGRNVHMDYVQEHFRTKKKIDFGDSQEKPNNILIEIIADHIYVKGNIKMRGISKLTMITRKITFLKGSKLDVRAPTLSQDLKTSSTPGANGKDGLNGVDGPLVEVYADVSVGNLYIDASGGNGNKGQDGAKGRKGADSQYRTPDKTDDVCERKSSYKCFNEYGRRGAKGGTGGNGGNAGKSGRGGNAGSLIYSVRKIEGHITLRTCPGQGGQVAKNGRGGPGGRGGLGGRGIKCDVDYSVSGYLGINSGNCEGDGSYGRGPRGYTGSSGQSGKAKVKAGTRGKISKGIRGASIKDSRNKYPLFLIRLMMRLAEDRVWANDLVEAKAVLDFVVTVTKDRDDASQLRKFAKRRIAFFNKDGFDRFGKNKLFAPLLAWEEYKKQVKDIKDTAKDYETAYNGLRASIEREEGVKQVLKALPESAKVQVKKQKERLVEAKRVAVSEKGAYVAAIKELESNMNSYLEQIVGQLPKVHQKSKFNRGDLFVVLQGLTAYSGNIKGGELFPSINAATGVIAHFATKCNTGTLQEHMDSVTTWLQFGEEYKALQDSSDLDFDKMDVGSVPEVMQANLEMNKEGLTADLVCMIEERSLPRNVASFKELIERFFIAGAARIDLIAKVIDLDNQIGGYNFDIPNLEETVNELDELSNIGETPIADDIQQSFLDNLLTSYQNMESSFSQHLYNFYKSYEFFSLWNVTDKLAVFERTASEAASGTGQLQGVVKLTEAFQEINNINFKEKQCFTKFLPKIDKHKWSFNSVDNSALFTDLHKGMAKVVLKMSDISDSSDTFYNIRLSKMYIELYGEGDSTKKINNLPAKVSLKVRRQSASYFKAGDGKIREFRQSLTDWRKFDFNRFAITDEKKCKKATKEGKSDSLYCLKEDDRRLQTMSCRQGKTLKCEDTFGAGEWPSPFGTYSLSLPIDENLECESTKISNKNCKDFDRSIYTKMNIWVFFVHWTGNYPKGPNDARCSTQDQTKDQYSNETNNILPLLMQY